MTHVLREVVRAASRLNKKEALEAVTVIDCPPMVGIGIVGYQETVHGLKPTATVWADHVAVEMQRRFSKHWYRCKKKAFTKHVDQEKFDKRFDKIKGQSAVVRLLAHTQPALVMLGTKRADVVEIQINGGSVEQKAEFARGLLEKTIVVGQVFAEGEQIDTVSVGKGRGYEGVIHRFGIKRLQKKTHRGRRKVGCIGPWNPMRIPWTVARAGNNGFHHRTEINKRIYRLYEKPAEADAPDKGGSTKYDLTTKGINPMGGFTRYGIVKNDFLLLKGSVCGIAKRMITLRKSINVNKKRIAVEDLNLKWIDTASKLGHGRFQTKEDRRRFIGKLKISKKHEARAAAQAKE
jgi:large subunit ribosomal protein L3e